MFTITGRDGAGTCQISQPDFASELANRNVIFRIPTPTFGLGLVEQIPDSAILANNAANGGAKTVLGIRGRANFTVDGRTISGQMNRNGNDGTITRFGWKAQNKSLLLFSGEAYNVEMGISNELFQNERDETANCMFASHPNSITNTEAPKTRSRISTTFCDRCSCDGLIQLRVARGKPRRGRMGSSTGNGGVALLAGRVTPS